MSPLMQIRVVAKVFMIYANEFCKKNYVLISSLNDSYFIISFSGHGFSSAPDKPKSYTFKKLLHDTQTIFDHFIPRNRECIVIGHSYGCSMAAALTRSRQGLLLDNGSSSFFVIIRLEGYFQ